MYHSCLDCFTLSRVVCKTSGTATKKAGIIEIEIGDSDLYNRHRARSADKFEYVVSGPIHPTINHSMCLKMTTNQIWVRIIRLTYFDHPNQANNVS